MSDEVRVNKQPQASMRSEMGQGEAMPASNQNSKMPWLILGLVVVIIVILGVMFRGQLFGKNAGMTTGSKSSAYQAVFLTNGQVYFGKLSQSEGNYETLRDIYYLQVVQQPPLQGTPQGGQQAPAQAQPQPQISLVKLGNELHGPVDEMHISRSQILFYEDLKSDGSVVKAIESYKATPAK